MQAIVFAALLACASANVVFRAPAHDSAVINSQRVGGNFAYSVAENQAYGVVSPVVSQVAAPVATTYTVQQPSVVSTVQAAHAPASTVAVQHAAVPVTNQVVSTYAAPYWYGNTVAAVKSDSPIVYSTHAGEKKIDQLSVQVAHQQPAVSTWSVPAHQQVVATAPVATTYAVQQPTTVVAGSPVATTYSVQQPATHVVSGSPVATYSYGVQQPIVAGSQMWNGVQYTNQWAGNQWNQWGYAAGHPWAANTVVV